MNDVFSYNRQNIVNFILLLLIIILIGCTDKSSFNSNDKIDIKENKIENVSRIQYEDMLGYYQSKSDSIFKEKFNLKKIQFKINQNRSYWTSLENKRKSIKKISKIDIKTVTLRYHLEFDTMVIKTPIEIIFDEKLKSSTIKNVSKKKWRKKFNLRNKSYSLNLSYDEAQKIVSRSGFKVIIPEGCLEEHEDDNLKFEYIEKDSSYYWTKIKIDNPDDYEDIEKNDPVGCVGKKLLINCESGKTTIEDYMLIRVINQ